MLQFEKNQKNEIISDYNADHFTFARQTKQFSRVCIIRLNDNRYD